jgi:hypothetical protein
MMCHSWGTSHCTTVNDVECKCAALSCWCEHGEPREKQLSCCAAHLPSVVASR